MRFWLHENEGNEGGIGMMARERKESSGGGLVIKNIDFGKEVIRREGQDLNKGFEQIGRTEPQKLEEEAEIPEQFLIKNFTLLLERSYKKKKKSRIREKRASDARERLSWRSGQRRDTASVSGCGKGEVLVKGNNCMMPTRIGIGSSGGLSSIEQPRRPPPPPPPPTHRPPANPNVVPSASPQAGIQAAPVSGYAYPTQKVPFPFPFTMPTQKPTTTTPPPESFIEKNYIDEPAGYNYPVPAKPFLYDRIDKPFSIPPRTNSLPIRPPSLIVEPPILLPNGLNRFTIHDSSTTRLPTHYSLLSKKPFENLPQNINYNSLSTKPHVQPFSHIFKPHFYNPPKNKFTFTKFKPLAYNTSEVTNSGNKNQEYSIENSPIGHIPTTMRHSIHNTPAKPKPEFIFRFFPLKTTHSSYNSAMNVKPHNQNYQLSTKPNVNKSSTSIKPQYPTSIGKFPPFSGFSTTTPPTLYPPSTIKPNVYHSPKATKRPVECLPPVFNVPSTFRPPIFHPSASSTPPVAYRRTTDNPVQYNTLVTKSSPYYRTISQSRIKYVPTTTKPPVYGYGMTTLNTPVYHSSLKDKFSKDIRPLSQTPSSVQYQGYVYDKPAIPFEF